MDPTTRIQSTESKSLNKPDKKPHSLVSRKSGRKARSPKTNWVVRHAIQTQLENIVSDVRQTVMATSIMEKGEKQQEPHKKSDSQVSRKLGRKGGHQRLIG